jgi:hypothetical protein
MKKIFVGLIIATALSLIFWATWWEPYVWLRDKFGIEHDFAKLLLFIALLVLPAFSSVIVFTIFWIATSGTGPRIVRSWSQSKHDR